MVAEWVFSPVVSWVMSGGMAIATWLVLNSKSYSVRVFAVICLILLAEFHGVHLVFLNIVERVLPNLY